MKQSGVAWCDWVHSDLCSYIIFIVKIVKIILSVVVRHITSEMVLHHRPSSAHIPSQSAHKLLVLLRDWMFPPDHPSNAPASPSPSIYDVWLASRKFEHKMEIGYLAPGAHRQFSLRNVYLAYKMVRVHSFEILRTIWVPQTSLIFVFNLCRGLFPAFRGYSQALIIDEVRLLITRGRTGPLAHT